MSRFFLLTLIILTLTNCRSKNDKPAEGAENNNDTSASLVWSDEFNYEGLPDSTKWAYDVGDTCDRPNGCGWGNNEKQYYTEKDLDNARVEDGHLLIEASEEQMGQMDYTSARLVTRGKYSFKYGRVEVRAQLPSGRGTWPAIWMLPAENTYGGWPKSGEIDIMEHVGYNPDSIFGTVHTEAFNHKIGTQQGGQIMLPDAESAFHVYEIDWTAEKIDFLVDDQLYFTFHNTQEGSAEWPFDQPFYLIMNIAVGGDWGGARGVDPDIWPQKMLVDYVRVYQ